MTWTGYYTDARRGRVLPETRAIVERWKKDPRFASVRFNPEAGFICELKLRGSRSSTRWTWGSIVRTTHQGLGYSLMVRWALSHEYPCSNIDEAVRALDTFIAIHGFPDDRDTPE